MNVKAPRPPVKGPAVKGTARPAVPLNPTQAPGSNLIRWAAVFAVALVAALVAYWPAMRGEFLFDDVHMPFSSAHPEQIPLHVWMQGARPLTDLSYWINYQIDGVNPFGYHLVSILLHTLAAILVFFIVRRMIELASSHLKLMTLDKRRSELTAAFCAAIFLLHPMQTEAVAYVSQRSENLSVLLAFAAWTCFLYRPSQEIRFPTVVAVMLLFGASVAAKEHVAVLPLVILLTDYYWNPGFSFKGIRGNWRLYGTFLLAVMAVASFLYSYLANEPTVGFHMQQFTWYQYLFTQCRVLFLYLRLFLLPFSQTADYAIELSRTPLEHGAIFGMIALVAASVAAVVWRKRYPIASFGFFVALVFFLPTSSIMPIKDLAAERRLYLPMIGLLLMSAEILVRLRWTERQLAGTLAALVLIAGVLTWNRSFVWSSPLALWSDTVEKSPHKARAQFGLAVAAFSVHKYADAALHYELAKGPEYDRDGMFYSNWALALDGAGRLNEAIQMGRKAVELSPGAATYAQQAMYLAKDGDIQQSLELLDKAEKADGSYEPIYIFRGNILMQTGHREQACSSFQKARTLNPKDPSAVKGLGVLGCGLPR